MARLAAIEVGWLLLEADFLNRSHVATFLNCAACRASLLRAHRDEAPTKFWGVLCWQFGARGVTTSYRTAFPSPSPVYESCSDAHLHSRHLVDAAMFGAKMRGRYLQDAPPSLDGANLDSSPDAFEPDGGTVTHLPAGSDRPRAVPFPSADGAMKLEIQNRNPSVPFFLM